METVVYVFFGIVVLIALIATLGSMASSFADRHSWEDDE